MDWTAPAMPFADIGTAPEAAPAGDYPHWDDGSRINIVFFGLRGDIISGAGP